MNPDGDYESESDYGSDDEAEEEEEPVKKKPNPIVVMRWKKVLPKKGALPKTGLKKLCETVLIKEL